jgi:hypothetical protein
MSLTSFHRASVLLAYIGLLSGLQLICGQQQLFNIDGGVCKDGPGDWCCYDANATLCEVLGCRYFCHLDTNGDSRLSEEEFNKCQFKLCSDKDELPECSRHQLTQYAQTSMLLCEQEADELFHVYKGRDRILFNDDAYKMCVDRSEIPGVCTTTGFLAEWTKICLRFSSKKNCGLKRCEAVIKEFEEKRCKEDPKRQLDLTLVLDSSRSVGHEGWDQLTSFASSLVSHLTVDETRTQVAIVVYDDDAVIPFNFGKHLSKIEVQTSISNLKFRHGHHTNLNGALYLLWSDVYAADNGARPGSTRVAVIFTDGDDNIDAHLTLSNASRCKEEQITLIAIGVSNLVNEGRLYHIASVGDGNVFNVSDFNRLADIMEALTDRLHGCPARQQSTQLMAARPTVAHADAFYCSNNGFTSVASVSRCYKIVLELVTWSTAVSRCSALNSHLAVIYSAEQHQAVTNIMANMSVDIVKTCNKYGYMFTAGQRTIPATKSPFVWKLPTKDGSDGFTETPFNYTNWHWGEPNFALNIEACMVPQVSYGYKWNDVSCDIPTCFICQIDL